MTCPTDEIRQLAIGDLDDPTRVARLREHCVSCDRCRILLDREERLTDALRGMERMAVPEDFAERVVAALWGAAPATRLANNDWRTAAILALAMMLGGTCLVQWGRGLQPVASPLADAFLLRALSGIVDLFLVGMQAALAAGQAGLEAAEALSGALRLLGSGLANLPLSWLALMLLLFALTHGFLYWLLRKTSATPGTTR